MLVLARKKNQRIMIGDDIIVEVVEIKGDRVRLGITADKTKSIHREEVYQAIKREEEASEQ